MVTEHNVLLQIFDTDMDRLNDWLTGAKPHKVKGADTMWSMTAEFSDGYQADIKLVSGGRSGEQDASLPYIDAVLFDMHGAECCVLESAFDQVAGDYRFEDCGHVYTVKIVKVDVQGNPV